MYKRILGTFILSLCSCFGQYQTINFIEGNGIVFTTTNSGNLWDLQISVNMTNIVHPYGTLMLVGDETFSLATNGVYASVTNYDQISVSGFTGNVVTGFLTNQNAGFYNVVLSISFNGSGGAGDIFEGGLFTNNVEASTIEWIRKTGSTDTGSAAAVGTLYLPANTPCNFRIQNTAATGNITLKRVGVDISKR